MRLKYERAIQLADEFVRGRNAFVETQPYEVIGDEDTARGLMTVKFVVREAPPEHLGPIVGDFIQNIRSGFNALAWILAGNEAGSHTEFPIFLSEVDYFAKKKNGEPAPRSGLAKLAGVDDRAVDVITDMQPFRNENPDRQGLWLIHVAAIVDRHESPTLMAGVSKRAEIRIQTPAKVDVLKEPVLERALSVGEHEMAVYRINVPKGKLVPVNLKANFDFEVAFDLDGPGKGALVPDVLDLGLKELDVAAAELLPLVP